MKCHCKRNNYSLPWILQNKDGHLMVFTQCSILNHDSYDVDENRSPSVRQRTETASPLWSSAYGLEI